MQHSPNDLCFQFFHTFEPNLRDSGVPAKSLAGSGTAGIGISYRASDQYYWGSKFVALGSELSFAVNSSSLAPLFHSRLFVTTFPKGVSLLGHPSDGTWEVSFV